MDWVITIPKTVSWKDYEREILDVNDGELVMNYRTRFFPKGMTIGDRCFIVHDGAVRGWMRICGLVDAPRDWTCQTTGNLWPAGRYIQRTGKFHHVDGPSMTGFRGVRSYDA